MQHRFTPTTFFIWGGLLIWATQFLLVYTFAAVACARRFGDLQVAGVSVVPLFTALVTCAALLATAGCLYRAVRNVRAVRADEHSRFIHFLAIALSTLALVAIVWSALPGLFLSSQCN